MIAFEIGAQLSKRGRFDAVGVVLEGAGHVVAHLALADDVDKGVAATGAFDGAEELGEDTGPEEEEIADVLVDLTLAVEGTGVEADVAFSEHVHHVFQPMAGRVTNGVDVVAMQKIDQHVAKVSLHILLAQPHLGEGSVDLTSEVAFDRLVAHFNSRCYGIAVLRYWAKSKICNLKSPIPVFFSGPQADLLYCCPLV